MSANSPLDLSRRPSVVDRRLLLASAAIFAAVCLVSLALVGVVSLLSSTP